MKRYPVTSPMSLEPFYCQHVEAMTAEGLFMKSDIAMQLALRDKRIAELEARCRKAAQILIECVGASGPDNVEEAAERAVKRIAELEAQNAVFRAHTIVSASMAEAFGCPNTAALLREMATKEGGEL